MPIIFVAGLCVCVTLSHRAAAVAQFSFEDAPAMMMIEEKRKRRKAL